MASHGESLIKRTQKGLSILAFETTKQSRILKKRMRTTALQKEIKADLRDLGNLVYNAMINDQPGILEEEEVTILVENIRENKNEVERLRDAIGRLSRAKKHFLEEEVPPVPEAPQAPPGEEAERAAGPEAPAEAEAPEKEKPEEPELEPKPAEKAAPEKPAETEPKTEKPPKQAKKEPAVPPAPGTDPEHPEAEAAQKDKPEP